MMQRLVGSIFAAPSELFFFGAWTAASLFRPLVLVTVICLLFHPTAAYRKFLLFTHTVHYLAFCNDKKWKEPQDDPASFFTNKERDVVSSKTVVFVRHGESTWNDTFNKGDRSTLDFLINFLPNLLYAAYTEWYFWVAGQANESWFYDSPLSHKGRVQAEGVMKFLQQDVQYMTPKEMELVKMLRGGDINNKKGCSAQLVSSNLRRAIATMGIGFKDRLDAKYENDTMLIVPALQEISRNPDALSITPPFEKVVPAWTDPHFLQRIYTHQVDTTLHTGNKPASSTNGLKRMQEFCRVAFDEIEKDSLVVAGHSLWFRSFFRTYLPRQCTHVSKKKKLVNGGVVGFTLQRREVSAGQYQYMIDPSSIVVLHGGF